MRENRRKEEEKKKKHERNVLLVSVGAVLAVILIAGLIIFFTTRDTRPDYAKMTVEYVDANGVQQSREIVVKLRKDCAPITVDNFKTLVSENFYDGLTFHRVMSGFMIQGGDPKGNGTGDSGKRIKGEFSANGVNNPLSHKRGVISMARGSYSMDSASCQFFIVHDDSAAYSLDGQYAAFGEVVEGMDVVDGIAGTAVYQPSGSNEKSTPVNPPRIVKIELIDWKG